MTCWLCQLNNFQGNKDPLADHFLLVHSDVSSGTSLTVYVEIIQITRNTAGILLASPGHVNIVLQCPIV